MIDNDMDLTIAAAGYAELTATVRAVLALHKPDELSDPQICGHCSYIPTEDEEHYFEASALYVDYPCPTVRLIGETLT